MSRIFLRLNEILCFKITGSSTVFNNRVAVYDHDRGTIAVETMAAMISRRNISRADGDGQRGRGACRQRSIEMEERDEWERKERGRALDTRVASYAGAHVGTDNEFCQ